MLKSASGRRPSWPAGAASGIGADIDSFDTFLYSLSRKGKSENLGAMSFDEV